MGRPHFASILDMKLSNDRIFYEKNTSVPTMWLKGLDR